MIVQLRKERIENLQSNAAIETVIDPFALSGVEVLWAFFVGTDYFHSSLFMVDVLRSSFQAPSSL